MSQQLTLLSSQKFGTLLTVLGVLLLDLNCDACQSPSRAFLLDVTSHHQHALGLTTFTVMAGLGGCLGYFLGGIPWEKTILTSILGDHIHVLFTLVWIIYTFCLIITLNAANESCQVAISIPRVTRSDSHQYLLSSYSRFSIHACTQLNSLVDSCVQTTFEQDEFDHVRDMPLSYVHYLRSIIYMPSSLRWLCLTNLFCWMALVSYSLFFTDFVGQAVFGR
jgi:solute carrier family 45, member 1/2/4